jgi:hypothetical protein
MSTDLRTAQLDPLSERRSSRVPDIATAVPARLFAAALCMAVVVIHVMDQGGFPGSKEPGYVRMGYYLLEAGGAAAAALLLSRIDLRKGWFLALGVALGPLVGYVLSRGPGLPLYRDDRGNWTETIGVISLVVVGILLLAALGAAATWRRGLEGPGQG